MRYAHLRLLGGHRCPEPGAELTFSASDLALHATLLSPVGPSASDLAVVVVAVTGREVVVVQDRGLEGSCGRRERGREGEGKGDRLREHLRERRWRVSVLPKILAGGYARRCPFPCGVFCVEITLSACTRRASNPTAQAHKG